MRLSRENPGDGETTLRFAQNPNLHIRIIIFIFVTLFITETENDHSAESGISPSQAMEGLDCAISFFEKTGILVSLSDMKILKRVRDELLKIKNRI